MSFPAEFRQNAVECRELARHAKSVEQRQGLLELAEWWEQRAIQFEQRLGEGTPPGEGDKPTDPDPAS